MEKLLIILRGIPGSGKSTFARMMWSDYVICEADKYWYDEDGNYNFDPSKLKQAHEWCQSQVRKFMQDNTLNDQFYREIVVSNTSTTEKELQPYLDLANEFGYKVVSLIVENRHGNSNVHNVPQETLQKMKDRFQIKLI
jgi:predicted kinase